MKEVLNLTTVSSVIDFFHFRIKQQKSLQSAAPPPVHYQVLTNYKQHSTWHIAKMVKKLFDLKYVVFIKN